jgi:hypothetical protein
MTRHVSNSLSIFQARQTRLHQAISMTDGIEEMPFQELLIFFVCLFVQLGENGSFPQAIMVDPDVL